MERKQIPLYVAIARKVAWAPKVEPYITDRRIELQRLMDMLPSGSGVDNGTKLNDASTREKLVFDADFHHMDENGFYCGWTYHQIVVKADLAFGITVRVTGQDRDGIKDYLAEMFDHILRQLVDEYDYDYYASRKAAIEEVL